MQVMGDSVGAAGDLTVVSSFDDEARNGLRLDSAVCYMVIIGLLGMGIDRLLVQLTKLPNVRWGYER